MLAGEPPFTGPTPQAMLAKRILGPIPPIRMTRPDVPHRQLNAALTKALAQVPASRFASAAEFSHVLAKPHTYCHTYQSFKKRPPG